VILLSAGTTRLAASSIPAKLGVQSVFNCVAAHKISISKPTYKRFESVRKTSFVEFCCRQKVASSGTGASGLHAAEMSKAGLHVNDDGVSFNCKPMGTFAMGGPRRLCLWVQLPPTAYFRTLTGSTPLAKSQVRYP
jgi:hypothetical protein